MWTISKEFTFDSAHSLPHLPATHKCHRLHGHTYRLVVFCKGSLVPELDWVIDYADIKAAVQPLVDKIDHRNLNEVVGGITTAENLARWFYTKLRPIIPVHRIDIHETAGTCCTYEP